MSLTGDDLLTPDGEIDGALFYPSVSSPDVSTRVSSYLTQGYAKATDAGITATTLADRVARAYAYYRAWSDVVNRLTLSPASTSLGGEVSTSYLQSQIDLWINTRDGWKHEFDSLLPVDASSDTPPVLMSRAVPTQIRF